MALFLCHFAIQRNSGHSLAFFLIFFYLCLIPPSILSPPDSFSAPILAIGSASSLPTMPLLHFPHSIFTFPLLYRACLLLILFSNVASALVLALPQMPAICVAWMAAFKSVRSRMYHSPFPAAFVPRSRPVVSPSQTLTTGPTLMVSLPCSE